MTATESALSTSKICNGEFKKKKLMYYLIKSN